MKFAHLTLLVAVAGCAGPPPDWNHNVSQERRISDTEDRCRYEAKIAMAGARERSIGDAIDSAVRENRLVAQCMKVRGG